MALMPSAFLCGGKEMRSITIEEAIASLDATYQNSYSRKEKENWIEELEEMIKQDIIDTHEDPEKKGKELYAKGPYTDMYLYYMQAQIDKNNGEYDRYTNHMALFNATYQEYENRYHRTHMPISHGNFKV